MGTKDPKPFYIQRPSAFDEAPATRRRQVSVSALFDAARDTGALYSDLDESGLGEPGPDETQNELPTAEFDAYNTDLFRAPGAPLVDQTLLDFDPFDDTETFDDTEPNYADDDTLDPDVVRLLEGYLA